MEIKVDVLDDFLEIYRADLHIYDFFSPPNVPLMQFASITMHKNFCCKFAPFS